MILKTAYLVHEENETVAHPGTDRHICTLTHTCTCTDRHTDSLILKTAHLVSEENVTVLHRLFLVAFHTFRGVT